MAERKIKADICNFHIHKSLRSPVGKSLQALANLTYIQDYGVSDA